MDKRVIVAIDGPAGAGKSAVARRVADALGFVYIDTGAMYRAVALWAHRRGVQASDMHRLEQLAVEADIAFRPGSDTVLLNGEDVSEAIRAANISALASQVSAVPAVRRAMVEAQHRLAAEASVVMEGRDIGTVVFPEARVKIYLDADPATRAARRVAQIRAKGNEADADTTAAEIAERDARDRTRSEAPLVQAPDAVYLDSTAQTLDQVVEAVLRIVRERTANGKEVSK